MMSKLFIIRMKNELMKLLASPWQNSGTSASWSPTSNRDGTLEEARQCKAWKPDITYPEKKT